ncbi:MAG: hypothetical protein WC869_00075 [Phycisphaerae bacterium]|jgi:hypothetical protein
MGVTPDTQETVTVDEVEYVLLAKRSGYTIHKLGVLMHEVHEVFKVDPMTNMQRAKMWLGEKLGKAIK